MIVMVWSDASSYRGGVACRERTAERTSPASKDSNGQWLRHTKAFEKIQIDLDIALMEKQYHEEDGVTLRRRIMSLQTRTQYRNP